MALREKRHQSKLDSKDYTMSSDELNKYYELFRKNLPIEIRDKTDEFLGREIANYLEKDPESETELGKLMTPLSTITSGEILETEFPPIPWIVSVYLGPGLTFLYGKPKVGKSWLALQLALSVLKGGIMFSQKVEQGKVLYLALEDNLRRLHKRMTNQGWPLNPNAEIMLYDKFQKQIGTLNSAGGKRLLSYIKYKKFNLVLVDTFSRAIQGNQLKSDEMTKAISPLQQYAMDRNISLVIVDHEPKHGSTLFGSVAKLGVADTFWRLYREKGKHGARLYIYGRDLSKEYNLQLAFDRENCFWYSEGDANEIEKTEREEELLEALNILGKAQVKEIADAAGQDRGNAFRRLQELEHKALVKRTKENQYVYYELSDNKLL